MPRGHLGDCPELLNVADPFAVSNEQLRVEILVEVVLIDRVVVFDAQVIEEHAHGVESLVAHEAKD